MRILLTGGTGYLGRAVVRALAARGHAVTVFARSARQSGLSAAALVDGDVRDRSALERAADGCDAIVHMAALVSLWRRRGEDFDDVNVGGLRNAIDAARAAGIRRMIYTSSFLALPPHGSAAPIEANDYQRTKVAADRLAASAVEEGFPLIRIYPGVIYGPGVMTEGNLVGRLIADHLKHKLPGVIGPEQPWSYAFIDDVAAGHCAAIERGADAARYILGGENATQARVFYLVKLMTGREPPRRIPFGVAAAIGAAEEVRASLFGGTPRLTRGAVDIFRHDWSLDSADAVRDLGYRITPLANGVHNTIDALREARV
jgi:NAD+-dependent farnesol dehydrogenase